MRFVSSIKKIITSVFYPAAGSFCVVAGWGWYHFKHRPHFAFVLKEVIFFTTVLLAYYAGRYVVRYVFKHLRLGVFWQDTFVESLGKLYCTASLFFVMFFLRHEIASIVYVSFTTLVLFFAVQKVLVRHPTPEPLLAVNKSFFLAGYAIFLMEAVLQYSAYHYYILDSNIKYFNIVIFRSVAMSLFWLLGLSLSSFIFWQFKSKLRYIGLVIWVAFFICNMVVWVVNVGILYYSGLYFGPVAIEHSSGAGGIILNGLSMYLVIGFLAVSVAFGFIFRSIARAHTVAPRGLWYVYNVVIVFVSVLSFFTVQSFRNTPEFAIARSFYSFYFDHTPPVTLNPAIQKKLEKFGLFYHPDAFFVAERQTVYSSTSTLKLLPVEFAKTKPNIIVIFLESFSARFTDVYNPALKGVTPNLDAFAADPHTTLFRNYYNGSTPTITGTLSILCSFLPPTGHNEIDNDRKLQNHHLLCLPEVLKRDAGFLYTMYMTAVKKTFANKGGIIGSSGVDKVLGSDELADRIAGKPLSWGYSDHQMFPEFEKIMKSAPQPFFISLATVDTHPPFNLAQDAVNYGDGTDPVLNMFHTTDDAFGKFWNDFKSSPFYNNTIVIAVADHAIFPGKDTAHTLWPNSFQDQKSQRTFYDQNTFLMYVPHSVLPKEVNDFSSSIDITPTLLHMLGVNVPNSFEGRSIFDDRKKYPNLLGMHELGLYINQETTAGARKVDYNIPSEIQCGGYSPSSTSQFTLCDYMEFYQWKRQMLEEGRFWKQ